MTNLKVNVNGHLVPIENCTIDTFNAYMARLSKFYYEIISKFHSHGVQCAFNNTYSVVYPATVTPDKLLQFINKAYRFDAPCKRDLFDKFTGDYKHLVNSYRNSTEITAELIAEAAEFQHKGLRLRDLLNGWGSRLLSLPTGRCWKAMKDPVELETRLTEAEDYATI